MVTFQSHESILYYISKDSKQTNKLACFDLDHTLWDFEENSKLTFRDIFNDYDFPFDYL